MVKYLDTFIDILSTRIVHLRTLLHKYIPWNWTEKEEGELRYLKKAVTTTPVFRYYDVNKEVLIQCDHITSMPQNMDWEHKSVRKSTYSICLKNFN